MEQLKQLIKEVPDFPKPGILFRDITPLIGDRDGFRKMVERFAERYVAKRIDAVVAIESRGFILGSAVAYRLGAGFVPVRKRGKLPRETLQERCTLEYGEEVLEVHKDSVQPKTRVLLVDDVLATGGTMAAVLRLMQELQADVVEVGFLAELTALGGRAKLDPHPIFSLIQY